MTSGGFRISQMGRGRQPLSLAENVLFHRIFAKNCMKMKEMHGGWGEGSFPSDPLGSANVLDYMKLLQVGNG